MDGGRKYLTSFSPIKWAEGVKVSLALQKKTQTADTRWRWSYIFWRWISISFEQMEWLWMVECLMCSLKTVEYIRCWLLNFLGCTKALSVLNPKEKTDERLVEWIQIRWLLNTYLDHLSGWLLNTNLMIDHNPTHQTSFTSPHNRAGAENSPKAENILLCPFIMGVKVPFCEMFSSSLNIQLTFTWCWQKN